MNGDFSALEVEKSSQFTSERAGGNYGAGTKEQQLNNFSKKKELEIQRLDLFDEAISLYNKKEYDAALILFEEVENFFAFLSSSFRLRYVIGSCFSNFNPLSLRLHRSPLWSQKILCLIISRR